MNLSTNRIIFIKTGLLLIVILFFLGCKKERSTVGINDPSKLPTSLHFTDTLTVHSQVVLINDSINTTNVTSNDTNSYMLAGAYTDPQFGNIASEAYTQLKLANQYIELPAATADSGYLYIRTNYYFGDTLQTQTLNVHRLTEKIKDNTTYYSTSPALAYDITPVGTITFNATASSSGLLKIKITDNSFLQSILNASKNNHGFHNEIPGIAFVPANNTTGAIIRIDAGSLSSILKVYYTQYGESSVYNLRFSRNARKFYRVTADRSATALSSLSNNYQTINTSLLANQCYVQACVGIRTKIFFPYLDNLRDSFPNLTMIRSELLMFVDPLSNEDKYPANIGLLLMRTSSSGTILKNSTGAIQYVQIEDFNQYSTSRPLVASLTNNSYYFPIKSYLQDVLLKKIPNYPLIVSPTLLYTDINRLVFNDNQNTTKPMKLRVYFTTTKTN